jgi:catechol 2,3-dioxygenase-like lactoylglutathione lyase family enzyme
VSVFQIGIVTDDVDRAAELYRAMLGREGDVRLDTDYQARFRGADVHIRNRNAFVPVAPGIHLELIQPGAGYGVQREWLETRGAGIFHIGYASDDVPAFLAGLEVVFELPATGTRYFDTVDTLGYYVELTATDRAARLCSWVDRAAAGEAIGFAEAMAQRSR